MHAAGFLKSNHPLAHVTCDLDVGLNNIGFRDLGVLPWHLEGLGEPRLTNVVPVLKKALLVLPYLMVGYVGNVVMVNPSQARQADGTHHTEFQLNIDLPGLVVIRSGAGVHLNQGFDTDQTFWTLQAGLPTR